MLKLFKCICLKCVIGSSLKMSEIRAPSAFSLCVLFLTPPRTVLSRMGEALLNEIPFTSAKLVLWHVFNGSSLFLLQNWNMATPMK